MEKLIRDNIPQIIFKSTGEMPVTRVLDKKDYKIQLDKKLKEEVDEYFESGKVEELADIAEVIFAIIKIKNVSRKDFEKVRTKKAKKNGRFNKKILLESI